MIRTLLRTLLAIAIVSTLAYAASGPYPSVGLYWFSSSDPTSGAGVSAPLKQLLFRTDVPSVYFKSGNAATAWTQVGNTSGLGGTVTSVACGSGLSCSPSPITGAGTASLNITPTTCSAGQAEVTTIANGTSACATFINTAGTGLSFSGSTANVDLATTSCSAGQAEIATAANGTSTCAPFINTAGTGLSFSGSTANVSLTPTTCSAGQAEVSTIANGTSTCSTFINTAGTGLSFSGSTANVNLTTTSCAAGQAEIATAANGTSTCAAFGSSSLTNGASNNVITKSNGTNLVASSISDDGTSVRTSELLEVGGVGQFSASTRYTLGGAVATTTTQTAIIENDVLHTAFEAINLVLRQSGTYDTTAQPSTASNLDVNVSRTRAAGANALTNIAITASASGGDSNYSFQGVGSFLNTGPFTTATGPSQIAQLVTTGALADLSGSTQIKLNQALTATVNKISFPGDSTNIPQFSVGQVPLNDNSNIQTKNTGAGQQFTGYVASLDTTVASGVGGGYYISRAAGGGGIVGGAQATNAGFMVAGTTNSQCIGNAVGDTCLFNFITSGNLNFATSNSATRTVAARISTGGTFDIGTSTTRMIASGQVAPTVNHGTLSADSSNFVGRVTSIGANTSVTLTFGSSGFGTTSHCFTSIASSGAADLIKITPSATTPIFSCFDSTTGVAANCDDFEYQCFGH